MIRFTRGEKINVYHTAVLQNVIHISHTWVKIIVFVTNNTNKPVGFYGPIALPSSERPSSECPPSFDRCMPQHCRFNQNILPNVVLLQQCHCRNCDRGRFQNLSPPSVLFESSWIFFTIHRRHRRKKWWTRILEFEFCDFFYILKIFKKASRGPSAADLDHYGRGQTRSQ